MSIKTAIIPAAGLGTRFLPATKQVPKELLPIVNRPAIEYVVDELIESGIERIIFVLHPSKMAILEHFQSNERIEDALRDSNKTAILQTLTRYQNTIRFEYVYQHEALGLGHAILCAQDQINEDYFAVILPDDLVMHETACLKQMLGSFEKYSSSVLALEHVPLSKVHQYGIIAGQQIASDLYKVDRLVEKPSAENAPSQQSVIGRYILHKRIFGYIEQQPKGALGEIQLTDALQSLAQNEGLYGFNFVGKRLDTGQPPGFIEANLCYGLADSAYHDPIAKMLQTFKR